MRPEAPQRLVLASASPRRRDLLREAGYVFTVETAETGEIHDAVLDPADLTCENALRKARAVAGRDPSALVLGADTLVYLDREPLGKPASGAEALGMLMRLQGRAHAVWTGLAFVWPAGDLEATAHDVTAVTFRSLTPGQAGAYLDRIDPLDKAGGYAAQEHGELILEKIEGSWSNVVGLPMELLRRELLRLAPGLLPRGVSRKNL